MVQNYEFPSLSRMDTLIMLQDHVSSLHLVLLLTGTFEFKILFLRNSGVLKSSNIVMTSKLLSPGGATGFSTGWPW